MVNWSHKAYLGCVLWSLQPYQLAVLQQLEQQLQEQQGEQESQQATEPQKLKQQAVGQRCSTSATNQSNTSADLPDQDNSVAEGAAGLLAMTSTADRTQATQVSCSAVAVVHAPTGSFSCGRLSVAAGMKLPDHCLSHSQ